MPLAVELISDLVIRPHFAADDLEREKEVVLQELAEVMDTPSDLIFDELWAASFADQPLGRSILGDEASIRRASAADLHDWRDQHYRARDLIIAAAGKLCTMSSSISPSGIFADLPDGSAVEAPAARFTGGVRVARVASEQAHLTFGFEGPAERADEYFAAQLFADILGGGSSSRLFHEVREARGLAYRVSADATRSSIPGCSASYAATAPREAAPPAQLIDELLARQRRQRDRARARARPRRAAGPDC